MNAGHELKNRYMHIDFENESATQSANKNVSKCQNDTLELSLEYSCAAEPPVQCSVSHLSRRSEPQ